MQNSTFVGERPPAARTAPVHPSPAPPGTVRRRIGWPLVAMATGLVVLVIAATVVAPTRHGHSPLQQATPVIAPDLTAITLSARDVSVVVQVYEPGQTSGWHAHSGIHAVAVLSGVLTVYDGDCHPETFEPGRPYVGGQQAHLVANETDEPVTMIVTYLNPTVPSGSTRHMAAPAGCGAG